MLSMLLSIWGGEDIFHLGISSLSCPFFPFLPRTLLYNVLAGFACLFVCFIYFFGLVGSQLQYVGSSFFTQGLLLQDLNSCGPQA